MLRVERTSSPRNPCQIQASIELNDDRSRFTTCLVGKWTRSPVVDQIPIAGSPIVITLRNTKFGTSIEALTLKY